MKLNVMRPAVEVYNEPVSYEDRELLKQFVRSINIVSVAWQTIHLGFRANKIRLLADNDCEINVLGEPQKLEQSKPFEMKGISINNFQIRCINHLMPAKVDVEAKII